MGRSSLICGCPDRRDDAWRCCCRLFPVVRLGRSCRCWLRPTGITGMKRDRLKPYRSRIPYAGPWTARTASSSGCIRSGGIDPYGGRERTAHCRTGDSDCLGNVEMTLVRKKYAGFQRCVLQGIVQLAFGRPFACRCPAPCAAR